jgi:hypothetical protein
MPIKAEGATLGESMSPPSTAPPTDPPRKRRKSTQTHSKRKHANGIPAQDPDTGVYSLLARSYQRGKQMEITLSEPSPTEECSITLEPIRDYRLPFLPPETPSCVVVDEPGLSKASLPCGHGFNAMALIYHFAKNSMTCPICRAGHHHAQMAAQSIPAHARKHFVKHLDSLHTQEINEQITSDAILAARILEQEIGRRAGGVVTPMARIVLLLYAYDSPDQDNAQAPSWTWELPLVSSMHVGTLEFESLGYSLQQLNLSLLRLPTRPRAFEAGIGVQSFFYGNMIMFRTVRFPATGSLHRVVFARDAPPTTDPLAIEIITTQGVDDLNVFYRFRWAISVSGFSNMIMLTAAANSMNASEEVVAV